MLYTYIHIQMLKDIDLDEEQIRLLKELKVLIATIAIIPPPIAVDMQPIMVKLDEVLKQV